MLAILKSAAAIVTAAAGLAYFAAPHPAAATTEFVEAAQKLQQARTLSFRQAMTVPGLPAPLNVRVLYKVPGLVRNEFEKADQAVSVMDMIRGKAMAIIPADKTVTLTDLQTTKGDDPNRPRDPSAETIEYIRQLAGKDGVPAGEKVIGEVRARGFRVQEHGMDMTVWVDPQKKLPVLIEFTGRFGDVEMRGTMSDIRLDPELDDALFRLDPPPGYAVRKINAKLNMTIEEAVARHLRTFTEASGGRFPGRLDDFADMIKMMSARKEARKDEPKPKDDAEIRRLETQAMELAAAVAQVMAFCQQKKGQYGYKAEGVKLGDAKAIVFWHRPEGQEKYRVVYGDLHTGEATAAELPQK